MNRNISRAEMQAMAEEIRQRDLEGRKQVIEEMAKGNKKSVEQPSLKVWIFSAFDDHYPFPRSVIVVAESAERATFLLNRELREMGVPTVATASEMELLDTSSEYIRVIAPRT